MYGQHPASEAKHAKDLDASASKFQSHLGLQDGSLVEVLSVGTPHRHKTMDKAASTVGAAAYIHEREPRRTVF